MGPDGVLADVQLEVARRFGGAVRCQVRTDTLALFCESSGATIGVTVDDPGHPSFRVTYPGFDPEAASWSELKDRAARGVLLPGLLWIVRAVERDGAVLPEFPTPGLRRAVGRAPSS